MNTRFVIIITASIVTVQFVHAWTPAEWCSEKAVCTIDGSKVKNTMCTMKPNPNLPNYKDLSENFDFEDRDYMLSYHNSYRNYLASGKIPKWPKAANMRQLTWDNDLQEVARRWAYQIKHYHDVCRRTEMFEIVGQNIGLDIHVLTPMSFFFAMWADEILNITPDRIVKSFEFGEGWSNFSNIIWADTYKIGCSGINFVPKISSYKPGKMIVCNYGPGRVNGSSAYLEGEPCTVCPDGTACNFKSSHPYLCALPNDSPEEKDEVIGKFPSRTNKNTVNYYFTSILMLIALIF